MNNLDLNPTELARYFSEHFSRSATLEFFDTFASDNFITTLRCKTCKEVTVADKTYICLFCGDEVNRQFRVYFEFSLLVGALDREDAQEVALQGVKIELTDHNSKFAHYGDKDFRRAVLEYSDDLDIIDVQNEFK